jgi:hypothetical protein
MRDRKRGQRQQHQDEPRMPPQQACRRRRPQRDPEDEPEQQPGAEPIIALPPAMAGGIQLRGPGDPE